MQKIDSHQHFWKYDSTEHGWINKDMSAIKHDFLPGDIYPVLQANNISGCIAIQVSQHEEENVSLLNLANHNSFIKGIVGWIDLQAADIEDRLGFYKKLKIVKGFRHILQDEPDRFMLSKKFLNGMSLLNQYNFTYDILIKTDQLIYACELVETFPDQRFVIDHMAKPRIRNGEIEQWKKDIKALAEYQNVYCKVSGFSTEADWLHWNLSDVKPYFDVVFAAFGINRLMYGSDWPVCLLSGGYDKMLQATEEYTNILSDDEQELFWSKNAIEFYQLNN
jgi:L-fuconolactonase